MIVLENDRLEFHFSQVHAAAHCSITFQRTLRIPDDGRDHAAHLPESWRARGGVIAPMHQAEALWIGFDSTYPFAVKVATGRICAITGDPWADRLNRDPRTTRFCPSNPGSTAIASRRASSGNSSPCRWARAGRPKSS